MRICWSLTSWEKGVLDVLKKGIKAALGTYRHRRREAELKRDQRHVTAGQIAVAAAANR